MEKKESLAEGLINGKNLTPVSPVSPGPRVKGGSKAQPKAPAQDNGKKKDNGKAPSKKDAPKPTTPKKDEFGFKEGSKASQFCKMVKDAGKTGITMDQVRKAKWNENQATYFGTLGKMKAKGRMKTEDGKIYFVR